MPNGYSTLPTDHTFRNELDDIRLIYTLRECHSNAQNYAANMSFAVIADYKGFYWPIYLHNGQPFDNMEDILRNGCTPNVSAGQGGSLQGAGMASRACAMHPHPQIVIGSTNQGETLFGTGHLGDVKHPNYWVTEDVTKEWIQVVRNLLGHDLLSNYNVIYAFKTLLTGPAPRVLKPKLINSLAAMAPSLGPGLNFHYCEPVIGTQTHPNYPTTARKRKGQSTGDTYRRGLSFKAYLDRFLLNEGSYSIPCNPFELEITNWLKINVSKASVILNVFSGLHGVNKRTEKSSPWMVNLRSGEHDGAFRINKINEFGVAPKHKAYLFVPWVSEFMKTRYGDEGAAHYSRFADNALGTYMRPGTLMGALGLQFSDRSIVLDKNWKNHPITKLLNINNDLTGYKLAPYVTIHINIEEIDTMVDTSGETEESVPACATTFLQSMKRQADFTFGNVAAKNDIMQKACEAAADNVPPQLKELCLNLFPGWPEEFVPITLFPQKISNKSRSKNVEVWNLDENTLFDGEFHTGVSCRLAIYHKYEKRFLAPQELNIHHSTRGCVIQDVSEVAGQFEGVETSICNLAKMFDIKKDKKKYPIPVFGVKISPLSRVDNDGEALEIDAAEYRHRNDFLPSRNITLGYQGERINLGKVVEVPKKAQMPPQPKPGQKKPGKKGEGKDSGVFTPGNKMQAYCHREENVLCEFVPTNIQSTTGVLKLNEEHKWVRKYFRHPGIALEGLLHRTIVDLYKHMDVQANNLYAAYMKAKLQASEAGCIPPPYDSDEAWDFQLNVYLLGMLQTPVIERLTDKIDKHIVKKDTEDAKEEKEEE